MYFQVLLEIRWFGNSGCSWLNGGTWLQLCRNTHLRDIFVSRWPVPIILSYFTLFFLLPIYITCLLPTGILLFVILFLSTQEVFTWADKNWKNLAQVPRFWGPRLSGVPAIPLTAVPLIYRCKGHVGGSVTFHRHFLRASSVSGIGLDTGVLLTNETVLGGLNWITEVDWNILKGGYYVLFSSKLWKTSTRHI